MEEKEEIKADINKGLNLLKKYPIEKGVAQHEIHIYDEYLSGIKEKYKSNKNYKKSGLAEIFYEREDLEITQPVENTQRAIECLKNL